MEIRAHYILVGAFAVAIVVLTVFYSIWVGKNAGRQDMTEYAINFQGDVSGLSLSSDVLFNGLKVGHVKSFSISKTDSSIVEVLLEVRSDVPVKTDSEASLETQGFTGQVAILISSGNNKSPLLAEVSKADPPVIKSRESSLRRVVAGLPEVLSEARHTFANINDMLNSSNRQAVTDILENWATISHNTRRSSEHLHELMHNLNKTAVDLQAAVKSADSAMLQLNDTIALASPGIAKFSVDGLDELSRLIADTRQAMLNLNRITQRLDENPKRFLLGTSVPEYKPASDGK